MSNKLLVLYRSLNTYHVSIQPIFVSLIPLLYPCLNTYHVSIQLNLLIQILALLHCLNTYHVSIQPHADAPPPVVLIV